MKNFSTAFAIIFVLFALLTGVIFALLIPIWYDITVLAFVFCLISLVILAAGFFIAPSVSKNTTDIFAIGILSTLITYSIVSYLTSLIFLIAFPLGSVILVVLQLIYLVVAIAAILLVYVSGKHVKNVNERDYAACDFFKACETDLGLIQQKINDENIKRELAKASDNLRFCNQSIVTDSAKKIRSSIDSIKSQLTAEQDSRNIEAELHMLLQSIEEHNVEMQQIQRGTF